MGDGQASIQPSVSIRLARREDAAAIAALATQLGYPSAPKEVERRLASILESADHAAYVAEAGGQVAAWIHAFVCRLLETDPHVEIGGLVVDEGFRGQGAGRRLVEQAEDWARRKGYRIVHVRSNIIRKGAHDFYERLGYSKTKTQDAFQKIL
jgi:GNAT superfamily N-acetyltransferase